LEIAGRRSESAKLYDPDECGDLVKFVHAISLD
jgi:hypothetical protein